MSLRNSDLYSDWLDSRGIPAPCHDRPASHGLFERSSLVCVLPWLRVYSPKPEPPSWEPGSWEILAKGRTRFLRADQVLDMIASVFPPEGPDFSRELRKLLRCWLVPVGGLRTEATGLLDHRIEAICLWWDIGKDESVTLRWNREANFPNAMRKPVEGMDPIHTPESTRAGLVSYLCRDWNIDDHGCLQPPDGRVTKWGPSTSTIPFHTKNTPRRLMLGTSMQNRVVDLAQSEPPDPNRQSEDGKWFPSGRNLHVVYSTLEGWTHEDGIVVSESAANQLEAHEQLEHRILVPAIAARTEITCTEGTTVLPGSPLVRCWVDLFAMGYTLHEANELGSKTDQGTGWLEIGLDRANLRYKETIDDIEQRPLETQRWRQLLIFRTHRNIPLRIGDKLSTRHGIKGVVSRILPDGQMPRSGDHPADIVISPTGVARRGAMGQFFETCPGAQSQADFRNGRIFVSRQPHHAQNQWTACNGDRSSRTPTFGRQSRTNPQRYGAMEFWALMMHGAPEIARELLGETRAAGSRWLRKESALERDSYQGMATRALNRFLSVVGATISAGQLNGRNHSENRMLVDENVVDNDALWIFRSKGGKDPVGNTKQSIRDFLADENVFSNHGGMGAINIKLEKPITVEFSGTNFDFAVVPVIPPWLRPPLPTGHSNPITSVYVDLVSALKWGNIGLDPEPVRRLIKRLVKLCLGDRFGAAAFLKTAVLGRRLTRSARAVIVPRPDLRIDQVGLNRSIADTIFDGLDANKKRLVLVNRNPTLHRRGLLALQPVINDASDPVIGLPLGILKALNADFDGDQACVIALETESALEEAERLRPGNLDLRRDPFRLNQPAFPLVNELQAIDKERELANRDDLSQVEWCDEHHALLKEQIDRGEDGWHAACDDFKKFKTYWPETMSLETWLEEAKSQMDIIYRSVREKGRLGGELKRQVFRRQFQNVQTFFRSMEAVGASTEPLSQLALNAKSGDGTGTVKKMGLKSYFDQPEHFRDQEKLENFNISLNLIDPEDKKKSDSDASFDGEKLADGLGDPAEPAGILKWMAKPTLECLVQILSTNPGPRPSSSKDPRISWFVGMK